MLFTVSMRELKFRYSFFNVVQDAFECTSVFSKDDDSKLGGTGTKIWKNLLCSEFTKEHAILTMHEPNVSQDWNEFQWYRCCLNALHIPKDWKKGI